MPALSLLKMATKNAASLSLHKGSHGFAEGVTSIGNEAISEGASRSVLTWRQGEVVCALVMFGKENQVVKSFWCDT